MHEAQKRSAKAHRKTSKNTSRRGPVSEIEESHDFFTRRRTRFAGRPNAQRGAPVCAKNGFCVPPRHLSDRPTGLCVTRVAVIKYRSLGQRPPPSVPVHRATTEVSCRSRAPGPTMLESVASSLARRTGLPRTNTLSIAERRTRGGSSTPARWSAGEEDPQRDHARRRGCAAALAVPFPEEGARPKSCIFCASAPGRSR